MSIATRDGAKRDAPSDDGVAAQSRGALFGRRKGHKLRPHQADLIEHLLPRLSLDIAGPRPPDLAELFDPRADEIRLEIGFGGGEHLIAEACAFARVGFIGCEPYVNGMAKILTQIDLIHPDPWPKRRHWKRRFVQDATVNAMARVLKPDGEFRFVSDIDDYCEWTLAHLARSPDFVWTAERADDWRLPWADYTMTRYGRKAEREGRHAAYLRFRRVG